MSSQLGLKQFRHEGCLSYLVFDRASLMAAVIHPRVDMMEDYRSYIAENRLRVVLALDTHIHADHFSGTHIFKAEYPCEVAMSSKTQSQRPGRKLNHGDVFEVGALRFRALETPGHTPDSISFHGEGLVFTGDTLLIGCSGRTDFPGADPAAQWNSIQRVLGELPDETILLPSHDYNDLLFSTIGVERKSNPHWKVADLQTFVAMKNAESIPHLSDEVKERVLFNQSTSPTGSPLQRVGAATACGVATLGADRTASINVEKYSQKLKKPGVGHLFLDVREPDEFLEGHIPGTRNIPMSELGLYLSELLNAQRVYISCLSGRRSAMAAKTLSYLGLPDVVNVSGGFKAWQNQGLPVKS